MERNRVWNWNEGAFYANVLPTSRNRKNNHSPSRGTPIRQQQQNNRVQGNHYAQSVARLLDMKTGASAPKMQKSIERTPTKLPIKVEPESHIVELQKSDKRQKTILKDSDNKNTITNVSDEAKNRMKSTGKDKSVSIARRFSYNNTDKRLISEAKCRKARLLSPINSYTEKKLRIVYDQQDYYLTEREKRLKIRETKAEMLQLLNVKQQKVARKKKSQRQSPRNVQAEFSADEKIQPDTKQQEFKLSEEKEDAAFFETIRYHQPQSYQGSHGLEESYELKESYRLEKSYELEEPKSVSSKGKSEDEYGIGYSYMVIENVVPQKKLNKRRYQKQIIEDLQKLVGNQREIKLGLAKLNVYTQFLIKQFKRLLVSQTNTSIIHQRVSYDRLEFILLRLNQIVASTNQAQTSRTPKQLPKSNFMVNKSLEGTLIQNNPQNIQLIQNEFTELRDKIMKEITHTMEIISQRKISCLKREKCLSIDALILLIELGETLMDPSKSGCRAIRRQIHLQFYFRSKMSWKKDYKKFIKTLNSSHNIDDSQNSQTDSQDSFENITTNQPSLPVKIQQKMPVKIRSNMDPVEIKMTPDRLLVSPNYIQNCPFPFAICQWLIQYFLKLLICQDKTENIHLYSNIQYINAIVRLKLHHIKQDGTVTAYSAYMAQYFIKIMAQLVIYSYPTTKGRTQALLNIFEQYLKTKLLVTYHSQLELIQVLSVLIQPFCMPENHQMVDNNVSSQLENQNSLQPSEQFFQVIKKTLPNCPVSTLHLLFKYFPMPIYLNTILQFGNPQIARGLSIDSFQSAANLSIQVGHFISKEVKLINIQKNINQQTAQSKQSPQNCSERATKVDLQCIIELLSSLLQVWHTKCKSLTWRMLKQLITLQAIMSDYQELPINGTNYNKAEKANKSIKRSQNNDYDAIRQLVKKYRCESQLVEEILQKDSINQTLNQKAEFNSQANGIYQESEALNFSQSALNEQLLYWYFSQNECTVELWKKLIGVTDNIPQSAKRESSVSITYQSSMGLIVGGGVSILRSSMNQMEDIIHTNHINHTNHTNHTNTNNPFHENLLLLQKRFNLPKLQPVKLTIPVLSPSRYPTLLKVLLSVSNKDREMGFEWAGLIVGCYLQTGRKRDSLLQVVQLVMEWAFTRLKPIDAQLRMYSDKGVEDSQQQTNSSNQSLNMRLCELQKLSTLILTNFSTPLNKTEASLYTYSLINWNIKHGRMLILKSFFSSRYSPLLGATKSLGQVISVRLIERPFLIQGLVNSLLKHCSEKTDEKEADLPQYIVKIVAWLCGQADHNVQMALFIQLFETTIKSSFFESINLLIFHQMKQNAKKKSNQIARFLKIISKNSLLIKQKKMLKSAYMVELSQPNTSTSIDFTKYLSPPDSHPFLQFELETNSMIQVSKCYIKYNGKTELKNYRAQVCYIFKLGCIDSWHLEDSNCHHIDENMLLEHYLTKIGAALPTENFNWRSYPTESKRLLTLWVRPSAPSQLLSCLLTNSSSLFWQLPNCPLWYYFNMDTPAWQQYPQPTELNLSLLQLIANEQSIQNSIDKVNQIAACNSKLGYLTMIIALNFNALPSTQIHRLSRFLRNRIVSARDLQLNYALVVMLHQSNFNITTQIIRVLYSSLKVPQCVYSNQLYSGYSELVMQLFLSSPTQTILQLIQMPDLFELMTQSYLIQPQNNIKSCLQACYGQLSIQMKHWLLLDRINLNGTIQDKNIPYFRTKNINNSNFYPLIANIQFIWQSLDLEKQLTTNVDFYYEVLQSSLQEILAWFQTITKRSNFNQCLLNNKQLISLSNNMDFLQNELNGFSSQRQEFQNELIVNRIRQTCQKGMNPVINLHLKKCYSLIVNFSSNQVSSERLDQLLEKCSTKMPFMSLLWLCMPAALILMDKRLANGRICEQKLCGQLVEWLQKWITQSSQFKSIILDSLSNPSNRLLSILQSNVELPPMGLSNPHSLCYGNSLFQALFNLDAFRQSLLVDNVSKLLGISTHNAQPKQEKKKQKKIRLLEEAIHKNPNKSSFLCRLRKMFTIMKYSLSNTYIDIDVFWEILMPSLIEHQNSLKKHKSIQLNNLFKLSLLDKQMDVNEFYCWVIDLIQIQCRKLLLPNFSQQIFSQKVASINSSYCLRQKTQRRKRYKVKKSYKKRQKDQKTVVKQASSQQLKEIYVKPTALLNGVMRTAIKPQLCKHSFESETQFNSLSLPVNGHNTLQSAIKAFFQPEILEGSNSYDCTTCENRGTAQCNLTIVDPPPKHMCLTLKRFQYSRDSSEMVVKLNHIVEFSLQGRSLQLQNGVLKECSSIKQPSNTSQKFHPVEHPQFLTRNQQDCNFQSSHYQPQSNQQAQNQGNQFGSIPIQYTLRSIIIHSGTSSNGHYRTLVKKLSGKWYLCDDKRVRQVGTAEVRSLAWGNHSLTGQIGSHCKDYPSYDQTCNAYMLFYELDDSDNQIQLCRMSQQTSRQKGSNDECQKFHNNAAFSEQVKQDKQMNLLMQEISDSNLHMIYRHQIMSDKFMNWLIKAAHSSTQIAEWQEEYIEDDLKPWIVQRNKQSVRQTILTASIQMKLDMTSILYNKINKELMRAYEQPDYKPILSNPAGIQRLMLEMLLSWYSCGKLVKLTDFNQILSILNSFYRHQIKETVKLIDMELMRTLYCLRMGWAYMNNGGALEGCASKDRQSDEYVKPHFMTMALINFLSNQFLVSEEYSQYLLARQGSGGTIAPYRSIINLLIKWIVQGENYCSANNQFNEVNNINIMNQPNINTQNAEKFTNGQSNQSLLQNNNYQQHNSFSKNELSTDYSQSHRSDLPTLYAILYSLCNQSQIFLEHFVAEKHAVMQLLKTVFSSKSPTKKGVNNSKELPRNSTGHFMKTKNKQKPQNSSHTSFNKADYILTEKKQLQSQLVPLEHFKWMLVELIVRRQNQIGLKGDSKLSQDRKTDYYCKKQNHQQLATSLSDVGQGGKGDKPPNCSSSLPILRSLIHQCTTLHSLLALLELLLTVFGSPIFIAKQLFKAIQRWDDYEQFRSMGKKDQMREVAQQGKYIIFIECLMLATHRMGSHSTIKQLVNIIFIGFGKWSTSLRRRKAYYCLEINLRWLKNMFAPYAIEQECPIELGSFSVFLSGPQMEVPGHRIKDVQPRFIKPYHHFVGSVHSSYSSQWSILLSFLTLHSFKQSLFNGLVALNELSKVANGQRNGEYFLKVGTTFKKSKTLARRYLEELTKNYKVYRFGDIRLHRICCPQTDTSVHGIQIHMASCQQLQSKWKQEKLQLVSK